MQNSFVNLISIEKMEIIYVLVGIERLLSFLKIINYWLAVSTLQGTGIVTVK